MATISSSAIAVAGEIGIFAVTATRRHVPARVRRLVEHLARTLARTTWL